MEITFSASLASGSSAFVVGACAKPTAAILMSKKVKIVAFIILGYRFLVVELIIDSCFYVMVLAINSRILLYRLFLILMRRSYVTIYDN
jgi:hypothetical protein